MQTENQTHQLPSTQSPSTSEEPRGRLNQTSEQFLMTLGERARVAGWLALVRACTLGQAARFAFNGDAEAARQAIESFSRYIGRVTGVKLPSGMGAAKGKQVSVYYLTEKGADALRRIAPELARHARPGKPQGANLARLPHELLVAETWLRTTKRREILEFLPETELKRRLMKERAQLKDNERKLFDSESNAAQQSHCEAVGDARMRVRERETGVEWTVDTEVAVNYRASQIKAKRKGMDWFACDKRQSRMVELVTGIPAMMLGDVTLPAGDETVIDPTKREKGAPKKVLEAMEKVGGAACAGALQRMLGGYRSFISRHLARLEREGKLLAEETYLSVEGERGRPVKLYYLPNTELTKAADVLQRAALSRSIIEVGGRWRVERHSTETGILWLGNEARTERLGCLIDHLDLPCEAVVEQANELYQQEKTTNGAVIIVTYTAARATWLRAEVGEERVWNINERVRKIQPGRLLSRGDESVKPDVLRCRLSN